MVFRFVVNVLYNYVLYISKPTTVYLATGWSVDWVKVQSPTRYRTGYLRDALQCQPSSLLVCCTCCMGREPSENRTPLSPGLLHCVDRDFSRFFGVVVLRHNFVLYYYCIFRVLLIIVLFVWQEALLLQRDRARHLSVEILQLQNISLENSIEWHYLRDSTFSRFDTIPECDRHRDTYRRTNTRRRHIPHLA